MISLDPKHYNGKPSLVIRTWNGIDQPEYYPVFDLTEDELGLDSGRFSRFMKKYNKNIYTLYLIIDTPHKQLSDIIDWICKYTEGLWNVDIVQSYMFDFWEFSFSDSKDAILFKLTWDAKQSREEHII